MGMTWVLIRGLAREAEHWGDFDERLEAAIPESQAVTLDLPGTGQSPENSSPLSISEIIEVVRKEVPEGPKILVGLSLGGMVATGWAMAHPEEITGLALINSSFAGFNPMLERLRPSALNHFRKIALSRSAEERERNVLRMVSNESENPEVIRQWAELHKKRPVSLKVFFQQLIAAARFRPPQSPPIANGLILTSLKDRLASPACSRQIHRIWKWPIRIHPTAGHELPLDAPDWVLDQLKRWYFEKING